MNTSMPHKSNSQSQTGAADASVAVPIDWTKTHLKSEFAHDRPLTCCAWAPKGRYLFFGAEDEAVHRFEIASQTCLSLPGHASWVRAIACTPDGENVVSGGYDGQLKWWPVEGQPSQPIRSIDAHDGWIRSLAISPDGKLLATCGNDHLVKLWDLASGEFRRSFTGHDSHVYNVAFNPNQPWLYSCDQKGHVKRWDFAEEASQADANLLHAEALHVYDKTFRADIGGARALVVSPDGKRLALGGITDVTNAFAGVGKAVLLLVDLEKAEVVQKCVPDSAPRGTTWGAAYHRDGFWITAAGGTGGGWLYFWNGRQDTESHKVKLPSDARGLTLSPDGRHVAFAHADRKLRTYALYAEPQAES